MDRDEQRTAASAAASAAAWDDAAVPRPEYEQIAEALTSAESPVGIDAKHTHVLILHALHRIERRLEEVERRMGAYLPPPRG